MIDCLFTWFLLEKNGFYEWPSDFAEWSFRQDFMGYEFALWVKETEGLMLVSLNWCLCWCIDFPGASLLSEHCPITPAEQLLEQMTLLCVDSAEQLKKKKNQNQLQICSKCL